MEKTDIEPKNEIKDTQKTISKKEEDILKTAGAEELIFALRKEPKRFSDLIEDLKPKNVTHSTINRRINDLLKMDIIKRDSSQRGQVLYELTEEGKKLSQVIEYRSHYVEIKRLISQFMEIYYKDPERAEELLLGMTPEIIAGSIPEDAPKKYKPEDVKKMIRILIKFIKVFKKIYQS